MRSSYLANKRAPKTRLGYSSVARSRGAAVTGEMKYYDAETTLVGLVAPATDWSGTETDPETSINLGAAPVATPLTLCAPTVGAGLNQRIGRDIKLMKVKVRGYINVAAQAGVNTADAAASCRILLVLDTQTNAAQMNGEDLLNGASAASATFNSFQNPNFFGRFRVLKDITVTLQDPSLAGEVAATNIIQSGLIRPFKMNVNLGGITSRFNATNGGTVADIVDNSLHIIAGCSNQGLAPSISYYSRVAYKE